MTNATTLTDLTIAEARDAMAKGEFTPLELTNAHLARMDAGRGLNAFITETPDLARMQAERSGERLRAGKAGPMEGIPIGIKDLFCTEGVRTTAGSKILDGFVPPYESTVSANLAKAGAVMLGKTNLDEFAMGSSNKTSASGPVINPWTRTDDDEQLVPGGSSGGSAAAVAGRLAMAATGTDTGGSIRQPAAFCGLVGLKPTYGRCSRWGVVAFASSLDQAGPMTRTVRDAAIMLKAMAGHDPMDGTSAPVEVPNFEAVLSGDIRGLRVGLPRQYRPEGLDPEIAALWDRGAEMLKDAGAELVEVDLPHTKYALATYYIVAPAEASSNLARYDGVRYGLRVPGETLDEMYCKTRAAGFGEEVRRRVLIGTYALSAGYYDAYYLKAQKVRALIAQDFKTAFETVDVLLTPTTPSAAFGLNETINDPITMYLNDVFTVPTSLAGLPGLSVPVGLSSRGLPLGLQLVGRYFDEETVLNAGLALERASAFTQKPAFLTGALEGQI
ncbi:Asp-tRNA(Asn)/Glu-tRNA(Gln) amidotransferase GatCAB subunit A [Rhodospirillum rubrum]|uniref:Asp-tRNA(Asn)/Glu-tRNA(Gln) amidotransferase subunit GatA n=1 Tax=Rhodospirillum rubrum TaxID=1085 RepID=UPI0019062DF5|nr:Asp-tRNA(Asn)/Glu-tRNA(Gln) amidotransferase subunit GatA [Rhodospirillum rubrum]MBK1663446.1 Asp-tRNA(Asn)/Glu-tRNA(Gln) amidotransferase GatCAB subunit A [Rhodospirillum rubrum]MBK1675371.1 Asp-tRNA(Asn)/Glu-tRNA(Gln) amidotransferase GatCAB subunit A [Rhodospirillum rubrum]